MQIDVQARGFSLTEALKAYVRQRVGNAFASLEGVQRIAVRLADINGPKGGIDKRCQLQVVLAGRPDVVIKDTESDMYAAIDRSAGRAGASVRRRLQPRWRQRQARINEYLEEN